MLNPTTANCLTHSCHVFYPQANARQRAGRAGRVRPGTCFTLYTRKRLESQMRPFQAPEMARVPLAELCLQVKLLKLGTAGEVLAKVRPWPASQACSE